MTVVALEGNALLFSAKAGITEEASRVVKRNKKRYLSINSLIL
jgi:hypothetical protein